MREIKWFTLYFIARSFPEKSGKTGNLSTIKTQRPCQLSCIHIRWKFSVKMEEKKIFTDHEVFEQIKDASRKSYINAFGLNFDSLMRERGSKLNGWFHECGECLMWRLRRIKHCGQWVAMGHKITNAPLILKIWEIIFCFWANYFMGISRDILRGPRLLWPPKFRGSKKSWPPQNIPRNGP